MSACCEPSHDHDHHHEHGNIESNPMKLALAGALALTAEFIDYFSEITWLPALLAVAAIALVGTGIYRTGWRAIKRLDLNVSALMTVAVTGAFLIGQWAEAAMVLVLFNIAEVIEHKTVDNARNSLASLLSLTPSDARLWTGEQWQMRPLEEAAIGTLIRVLPGERIPLDGLLVEGNTSVDESAFTGESLPVNKQENDALLAGTININGSIVFKVTQLAQGTALAKMIAAVEAAQAKKPAIERWMDNFARIYTPIVFGLAILTFLLLPLITQQTWLEALHASLVMLVIACPCALVLATPITMAAGLTHAARNGILIKGGGFLEQARNINVFAFDKTGTLTHGTPVVASDYAQQASFLTLGAELAYTSQHPASQAIASHYQAGKQLESFIDITDVPSCGIQGRLDGQLYFLGHLEWVSEQVSDKKHLTSWQKKVTELENDGHSVTLLASENDILALYALKDTLRTSAKPTFNYLHKHSLSTLMLTGDNPHTAQLVANEIGIQQVFSRQSPQDKINHVTALQQQDNKVAMVGDGINDGLALVQADIGISLGLAGTDVAKEAADITFMDNSLSKLPYLITLSKRTHSIIQQNIGFAVGSKLIVLALAILGIASMWMAVLADVGVSLVVVANGLRALKPLSTNHSL